MRRDDDFALLLVIWMLGALLIFEFVMAALSLLGVVS